VTHRSQQFERLGETRKNSFPLDNASAIRAGKHARVRIMRNEAINLHRASTSRVLFEKFLKSRTGHVHGIRLV
jgi:hypothetical protein